MNHQLPPSARSLSGYLLPRHGDADGVLGFDQVVDALGGVGDLDLDSFYGAVELIAAGTIVGRNRRARVDADIATVIGGEDHRLCHRDLAFADLCAINEERYFPALTQSAAGVGELHAHLALARRDWTGRL